MTKVSIGNVWDRYRLVCTKGLDPNKKYHCPQLNITCSGALLMNAGIDKTELEAWDYQSAKLYFHTVDEERYYETF